jgi:F-type H+-transporting ATPase subunit b
LAGKGIDMTQIKTYLQAAGAVAGSMGWTAAARAAGASEPGLPQLDISTWPSQLFWLVVLFGVGYVVMAKLVTPRIGAVLEERRQTLDGDLDKARSASEDAASSRAKYEADLEKARAEAAEFARQAAAEATRTAEAAEAKTVKKLAEKTAKAEAKLVEAKNSALANLNEVAAAAAVEAVAAIAGLKTTAAKASKTASGIEAAMAKRETN